MYDKRKAWTRVIFRINYFSGIIKKEFNPQDLNNKVNKEEIENILTKIEKETKNFDEIRLYTKIKYFIVSCIILLVLTSIVLISLIRNWTAIGTLLSLATLFTLIQFYISFIYFHKLVKSNKLQLNKTIHNANESLFLKRRLLMMSCKESKSIAVYIIPLSVNLGILIHNMSGSKLTNSTDDYHSVNEQKSIFNNKNNNNNNLQTSSKEFFNRQNSNMKFNNYFKPSWDKI